MKPLAKVNVICNVCGKKVFLEVPEQEFTKWMNGEGHIQNLLPMLTPGERELLISHVCEPCFDKLFGDEL